MFFILPQYSFIIYYCFYVISFISCPPCPPKLFLNFCAALLLQSMITLAANFLSIRFLWDCLFVPLLDHIYVLHSVNHILLFFLANFYYVIFLLYVFHFTPIFFHYLLLFLRHFFRKLSTLLQPYLCSVFYRIFRISFFLFHFIIFS